MGLANRIGLYLASIPLALASMSSLPPNLETIVAQDKKEISAEQQTEDLYTWLTEQHTQVGDSYKNAKLYIEAKEQYQRALHFTPNNQKIKDIISKLPEKNDAKDPAKARKNPDKKYETLKKEAIKKIEETGKKLITEYETETDAKLKLEKKYKAFDVIDEIFEYDKTNELPFTLRPDFVKYEGIWMSKNMATLLTKAKETYSKSPEGEKYQQEDDLEKDLKLKNIFKRKQGNLITRSGVSDERAKELLKRASATIQFTTELLDIGAWPFDSLGDKEKQTGDSPFIYRHTEFAQAWEFNKYCEERKKDKRYDTSWCSVREQPIPNQRHKNDKTNGLFTVITYKFNKEFRDDTLANETAQDILSLACSKINVFYNENNDSADPPWLRLGFGYLTTAYLFNTTLTNEVIPYDDKYQGPKNNVVKISNPNEIRKGLYKTIINGQEIQLEAVINTPLQKFYPIHAAQSISFLEYAFTEKTEEIRQALTDRYHKNEKFTDKTLQQTLEEVFNKPMKEIHEDWKKWAKYSYAGYKN